MVNVVGFETRENAETKENYSVLILQDEPEILVSKSSGKPYVSAKRASIPCALGKNQAQALVGTELPGRIDRVSVTPFDVTLPSAKKVKVSTAFQFIPPEQVKSEDAAQ